MKQVDLVTMRAQEQMSEIAQLLEYDRNTTARFRLDADREDALSADVRSRAKLGVVGKLISRARRG